VCGLVAAVPEQVCDAAFSRAACIRRGGEECVAGASQLALTCVVSVLVLQGALSSA
jgi:hypothetical protein